MVLGIITDEIAPALADALRFAGEQGLDQVELRTVAGRSILDYSPDELQRMRDLLEQHELSVSCIATPIFKSALDGKAELFLQRNQVDTFNSPWVYESPAFHLGPLLDRALRCARIFGAPYVRVFSFFTLEGVVWAELAGLLSMAQGRAAMANVRLLVENEPCCNLKTTADLARLGRYAPELELLWDPGNAYLVDPHATYSDDAAFLSRVRHVHVKGIRGQSWVSLFESTLDYRRVYTAFAAAGCEPSFSLETHAGLADSEQNVAFLRALAPTPHGCYKR